MDRITTEKRDGSDELAGSCEAISPGPPGSNRVIKFPGSAARPSRDREDTGVSSASVSSLFIPLGMAAHAVVMKLQGGFSRIRVERATEGDFAARSDDRSAAWEEEDQR